MANKCNIERFNVERFSVEGVTIKGGQKKEQEDTVLADSENGIFILADGMSGHNGRYASSEAVDYVGRELRRLTNSTPNDCEGFAFTYCMKETLALASQKLLISGEIKQMNPSPGTTLDAVVLRENDTFYFAHVGDSRIYAVTKDKKTGVEKVRKLTEDQSSLSEIMQKYDVNEDAAKIFYDDEIKLNNFLGNRQLKLDGIQTETIQSPKKIVMMSDGLSDIATTAEIDNLLLNYSGKQLIEEAVKIYQNPIDMLNAHVNENPDKLVEFAMAQRDEKFYELQTLLVAIHDAQGKIDLLAQYRQKNPAVEKILFEQLKKELKLAEKDNFSIIVIEPKMGLK